MKSTQHFFLSSIIFCFIIISTSINKVSAQTANYIPKYAPFNGTTVNSLLYQTSGGEIYFLNPDQSAGGSFRVPARFTINGTDYSGPAFKILGSTNGMEVDGEALFNNHITISGTNSMGHSLTAQSIYLSSNLSIEQDANGRSIFTTGYIHSPKLILGDANTPGGIYTCAEYIDLEVRNTVNPCANNGKNIYNDKVISLYSGRAKVYGLLETNSIKISDGAATGKVLVSNSEGLGSWTNVSDLNTTDNNWIKNANNDMYSNCRNVGIGVVPPVSANYKLYVGGGILATEVKVQLQAEWSDYVFKPQYKLRSLNEVESFISQNGHLPEVPNAETVKNEGIKLGEMNALLLKKIEELTLYVIEQQKQIDELKESINK